MEAQSHLVSFPLAVENITNAMECKQVTIYSTPLLEVWRIFFITAQQIAMTHVDVNTIRTSSKKGNHSRNYVQNTY